MKKSMDIGAKQTWVCILSSPVASESSSAEVRLGYTAASSQ